MFENILSLSVDQEDAELHGNLAPAIRRALEAQQARAQEVAANEFVQLLDHVKRRKTTVKREIRRLRREADRQAKALDRLDRANAYGQETGNFIPLLIELGMVRSPRDIQGVDAEDFERLRSIPSDWQPTPPDATETDTQGEATTETPPTA